MEIQVLNIMAMFPRVITTQEQHVCILTVSYTHLDVYKRQLWALKPLLNHALTATIDEQVVRERVAQGHLLHGMARAAGLS